jgi:polysaccharide export outer membrane protein
MAGLQREALVGQGDIRTFEIERYALLARQARVDAVIENKASVIFPADLTKQADQPLVARMMREEQDLFNTRQRSLAAEIDALNQGKVLAVNQTQALKSKATSLAKQIDLATKDMANVTKLVSAGLTVSARSLGASQNLSDLESRNLDVALADLKAQQDVAKADQDIANANNRYRVDALTEAADVRDRLSINAEKAATALSLLDNVDDQTSQLPISLARTSQRTFETTIDRSVDGRIATLSVHDNDPVLPGDVLRVERPRDQVRGSDQKMP